MILHPCKEVSSDRCRVGCEGGVILGANDQPQKDLDGPVTSPGPRGMMKGCSWALSSSHSPRPEPDRPPESISQAPVPEPSIDDTTGRT